MSEFVAVDFAGEGSGRGPLTWGQLAAWRTFLSDGEAKSIGGAVPIPAGTTTELVVDSLRYIMGRHQALRTLLHVGPDNTVEQEVVAAGTATLEVVDAAPGTDPAEVAEQVRRRYVTDPWDYARDWPVRMALVRQDGRATHTVAVYLQTAMDAPGLAALATDLLAYFDGRPVEPVTAIQPLELAAKQAGAHARRQSEASLRHMEQTLLAVPMHRFPDPVGPGPSDWETLRFRSSALALAVEAVAARRGIDTSPVLLGAYGLGLAEVTGVSPVAILLAVSNRFRPGFAESVSPVVQVATCLLDVAGGTLDDVVGRAWQAAMSAYKYAYYHPLERSALARRIGANLGGPRDVSTYFNDRRGQGLRLDPGTEIAVPSSTDLDAARAYTQLRWERLPGCAQEIAYLNIDEAPGLIQLELTVDTTVLDRPATERVLRRLEEAAIGMALAPDTPAFPGTAAVAS
jgi:hypothetical protein